MSSIVQNNSFRYRDDETKSYSFVEIFNTSVMPWTVATHKGTRFNPQSLEQKATLQSRVELSAPSNEPDNLSEGDEDAVYEALKIYSNISEKYLDAIRNKF